MRIRRPNVQLESCRLIHVLLAASLLRASAGMEVEELSIPITKHQLNMSFGAASQVATATGDIVDIPLESLSRMMYRAPVGVGSPAQILRMDFDTGSTEVWVPRKSCQGCKQRYWFNENESTTFHRLQEADAAIALSYGSGKAEGFAAEDELDLAGLSLSRSSLIVVTEESIGIGRLRLEGLFGLGFRCLLNKVPNVERKTALESLAEQHGQALGDARHFFFDLKESSSEQSYLRFGGDLASRYPSGYAWVDVAKLKYSRCPSGGYGWWAVDARGVVVGGEVYRPKFVIVDSGTSCIGLPSNVIQSHPGTDHSGIVVHIGDYAYAVNGSDLNCVQKSSIWILGDTFHRKFAVTYDYGSKRPRIALPVTTRSELAPWMPLWAIALIAGCIFFTFVGLLFACVRWRRFRPRRQVAVVEPMAGHARTGAVELLQSR